MENQLMTIAHFLLKILLHGALCDKIKYRRKVLHNDITYMRDIISKYYLIIFEG